MREIILKRILSEPLMHNSFASLTRGILWKRGEERGGGEEERRRGEEGRTLLKFRYFIQSEREFMKDFV